MFCSRKAGLGSFALPRPMASFPFYTSFWPWMCQGLSPSWLRSPFLWILSLHPSHVLGNKLHQFFSLLLCTYNFSYYWFLLFRLQAYLNFSTLQITPSQSCTSLSCHFRSSPPFFQISAQGCNLSTSTPQSLSYHCEEMALALKS